MDYAKHLIERITSAPENERVAVLSNELLREFHRGYPLDDLRVLLRSDDERILTLAAWLLSELGEKSRPLLNDVVPLLSHPLKGIRFWVLASLFWTSPQNGCDLAQAFELLEDSEPGIRWKVLDILTRVSLEQIEAARNCLELRRSNLSHLAGLSVLRNGDPNQVITGLRSDDPLVRKYAFAAAVRVHKDHPEPIAYASTVDDDDIKGFLSDL